MPRGPGPTPLRLTFLTLGGFLLAWGAYFHPSLHTLWQAPLGALIFMAALGKIVSR